MTKNTDRHRVHRLVQEQYERFPYPQAPADLYGFRNSGSFQGGCPSQFFHYYWPYREKTGELDILVAGCGTMQAPKFAINLPDARITAIDISDNSIEHTNRLVKLHKLTNVRTRKLPLEDAGMLGEQYDLIVSTGVLHHLPDPAAGLTALHSVLRNEGSMYLMLYGKYGRDGIYYIQELLRRAGLSAASVTDDQLQDIRQLLQLLPGYHPLTSKRHFFGNFQVGDIELVDLFLHPQDRGYSIPDIVDLLGCCNMRMQHMLFRAHYSPRCCALVSSGLFDRIDRLPDISQLAIGELYRAAAHMHFFVACRNDRAESTFIVDLDGPGLERLIPVKAHGLGHDRQNLPDGAAAALTSRMYQFADLRCLLDDAELAMFRKVDGICTVGGIIDAVSADFPVVRSDSFAREFCKKLHDYDILSFRG